MKTVLAIAVLAVLAATVSAECNNMCSGHGVCALNDMCKCYRNWRGADCSERTCQFGRSFVDTAQGDLNHDGAVSFASSDLDFDGSADTAGTANGVTTNWNTDRFVTVRTQWKQSTFELFPASTKWRALNHVYMECSNKGVCDRATGECACYEGYEGSACQRSVCPNKCSGHGVCRSITDITQSLSNNQNYTYTLWDAKKIQACVCDPGYGGYSCEERKCPHGDDPLSPNAANQVHTIFSLDISTASNQNAADQFTKSFRFQYVDQFGEEWTSVAVTPVVYVSATASTHTDDGVAAALTGIPNNVIPSVTVSVSDSAANAGKGKKYLITFSGNAGDQSTKLQIIDNTVLDWAATPAAAATAFSATQAGTTVNEECSNRGLCDYSTGICKCFRGYRLDDCSGQSALAYGGN